MIRIAFSYSHADEELRNHLDVHLAGLKRQGIIESWHDRRLVAGDEIDHEIDRNFRAANIILLLISPHFIASDYCYDIETKNALDRHAQGNARVIPVILKPCDWKELPFGKLLAVPKDGKPIVQFQTLDEGFLQVVHAIKAAIAQLQSAKDSIPSTRIHATATVENAASLPASNSGDRSSNLRIRKTFTDKDIDDFRRTVFDYIVGYFENSLDELKRRNPKIETSALRNTKSSLEATIYSEGQRKCHCGIWIGNSGLGSGEILFSQSGVSRNSYNESLSVDDDGYSLGLKPIGMIWSGSSESNRGLLTSQGAAEFLWGAFVQPLQR